MCVSVTIRVFDSILLMSVEATEKYQIIKHLQNNTKLPHTFTVKNYKMIHNRSFLLLDKTKYETGEKAPSLKSICIAHLHHSFALPLFFFIFTRQFHFCRQKKDFNLICIESESELHAVQVLIKWNGLNKWDPTVSSCFTK